MKQAFKLRANWRKILRKANFQLNQARETNVRRLYYAAQAAMEIHQPADRQAVENFIAYTSSDPDMHFALLYILLNTIADADTKEKMISNETVRVLSVDSNVRTIDQLAKRLNASFGISISIRQQREKLTQYHIVSMSEELTSIQRSLLARSETRANWYWMTSGKKFTRRALSQKDAICRNLDSRRQTDVTERQQMLIELLNGGRKRFDPVRDEARNLRNELLLFGDLTSKRVRRDILFLSKIEMEPQPKYKAVRKTKRLYAYRGFPLLTRESRHALSTRMGWVEVDLKSAQLVLVRNLFKLHELDSYLEPKHGVWNELIQELSLEDNSETRSHLKSCVYRVVFGGSMNRALMESNDRNEREIIKAFKASRLHSILATPISRAIKLIRTRGYIIDAYGNMLNHNHEVVEKNKKMELYDETPSSLFIITEEEARSMLAHQIQSIEFRIMEEAFIERNGINGMELVGWMHDGVILKLPAEVEKRISIKKRVGISLKKHEAGLYGEMGIKEYKELDMDWKNL